MVLFFRRFACRCVVCLLGYRRRLCSGVECFGKPRFLDDISSALVELEKKDKVIFAEFQDESWLVFQSPSRPIIGVRFRILGIEDSSPEIVVDWLVASIVFAQKSLETPRLFDSVENETASHATKKWLEQRAFPPAISSRFQRLDG